MKKNVFGWMAVAVLSTLACGMIVPVTTPSQAGVETIVAETMQALTLIPPAATQTLPAEVSTVTATGVTVTQPVQPSGVPVSFQNVSFEIPNGLATSANTETVPAVGENDGALWDVAPAYSKFTLMGYPLQGKFFEPHIMIYPAQEYAAAQAGAAESISRLQVILASLDIPLTNDALPYLPFANAAQIFFAQPKLLSSQSGLGIRFLTEYAQYFATVNNHDLFYHFQGLTGDGEYYIIAILPVTAPILAADENPESPVPAGGIPFPGYEASEADMQAYYENVTKSLDAIDPDSFSPSLSVLDSMISSIQIVP
jgi:hypothetical protein